MKRFYHEKKFSGLKQLASILLFLGVACAFYVGVTSVSDQTSEKQMESLSAAIQRSIIHCYATEGHYPESLDALIEEYNIQYDSDRFFVDYQVLGENIMPDVTIIDKEDAGQ